MRKTKKLALAAVLIALALALSYLERFLPLQLLIPLPGIKLGLANVVTVIALYLLGTRFAFAVLIPRCILGGIFGGLTGILFSLTGGILAMAVMALCRKLRLFSVYGVSVLGAAAHNIGQILAAMAVLGSVYVGAYLPYLLAVAVVTGLATGALSGGVLRILERNGGEWL